MADVGANSVADLPQRKIWRQAFASKPLKFSLFAVGYLIAYGYGNFSQTAASPLWFPDSVLLCALLLTPINEWWLYLVVAVPIRFIPTHHPAVPLWFVFATSANDLIKATLAAYLLRRLPNGSRHPSTVPQLATFLAVGVFFIPALSAFAGAATRYLLGYGFWVSWYQWFLGDALANVVLTPALLYWCSKYFRALRPRTAELTVWIAGFALALTLALSLAHSAYSPIALCIPVPFLIWAATRFGLIGASTSLSVIAVLATARIAEKGALFSTGFESKSLLFLQLFLFVVSIPVLSIAIVIEEKIIVEKNLRESEQRLRLAQQAARIGTFEWNIQTGVNTWTRELEAMYGLPPGGFEGTQTAFEKLIHPDDRTRVIELVNWALKTGQPTTGEWRVVWADGSMHWIAGRWQVFMNDSDEPSRMVGINIDMTDRKRAEQELSEANERLRLALEAGSAGGWDYDLKTGKNVWFGTSHEQLGMTPDETSGSRKEFWDRIHEDDRERVEHALQVAKEKREVYAEDFRVVWRDGTTHWLRSRGRFQYDANGEAERLLGISLDITERKMAEERLREYERAVENAEEMIAVVDREYRYLIANRQFLKMRNMTQEQVVGRFAYEVLDKGFFETVAKPKLDECFRGRVVKYETKYSYPETGERDLFISYFPIEGGSGIDRVACIMQDITDRKRAEDALVELNRSLEAQAALLESSEELLKIFVKNVPAAVAMLDRDMRYLQVSDRWCTDYLFGRVQIIGRSHYEIFPDMPERWKEVHRRALAGETLREDEDHWVGQDGSHWARWEVRPWKTHKSTVGGILILTEDITRRKRAEEALAVMTRKLIQAQEQERARIGRELHDDINQRLAMLAVELEQLQSDPSDVQNRVQELRKQTAELSNDVQALSHELHSSKLEYLGVVSGIKSWCREFGERQAMKVEFKSDVSSVPPLDVGICLFRVLQESLHNAAKYSGVKRIEVQLQEVSNEIHLIITDLGRGFDVGAALQGQGLGLTSMQERVRLLNGSIEIQSKPMGGTTVHVRVPFESERSTQRAAG